MYEGEPETPWKPTRAQLDAAAGRTVPDVIAPKLKVLFCGINPGLYSGAVGHHFAHPSNRFWKTLQTSGFTDVQLSPFEEARLLRFDLGITNLVQRASRTASELTALELREGGLELAAKVAKFKPKLVAFLGIGAYRTALHRPKAVIGLQDDGIAGSKVWLLPQPSGLQATYQIPALVEEFRRLRDAAESL